MDVLHLNPASFAKVLGVSGSTVRNYFDSERNTKPGYDVLEKLYHSFRSINLPWLFGEPGQPFLSDTLTQANEDNATYATNKNFSHSQVISGKGHKQARQEQSQGTGELAAAQQLIEQLRAQLADKERTIQILLTHQQPK